MSKLKDKTFRECKIVETTDRQPPIVGLSYELEDGTLVARCQMCYRGKLIGTVTIDGGDAPVDDEDLSVSGTVL